MGSRYGTTVWSGSAFDCSGGEITLLHSFYAERTVSHAYGECNNGSIVAQSLRVENMCYISQLNITVGTDMIGKSIECNYDDGNTETSQLVGALNINTGKSYPFLNIDKI